MPITIPPELEARLLQRAEDEGMTVSAYLEQLLREEEWAELLDPTLQSDDAQTAEIRAAVAEALDQAERGEGRSAEEVFRDFRAKHRLSR